MKLTFSQYVLKYSCILIISILILLGSLINNAMKKQTVFTINTNQYFEYIKEYGGCGSEPPTIIYADEEKVIINNIGLIIFEYKTQTIKILDTLNIDEYSPGYFVDYAVTKDGNTIFLRYSKNGLDEFLSAFSYDIDKNKKQAISKNQFLNSLDDCIKIHYAELDDEIYEFTGGMPYIVLDNGNCYTTKFENGVLYLLVREDDYVNRYEVFKI